MPRRQGVISWKEQLSILGALASIAGFIFLGLRNEQQHTFVILSLVVLFFISSSIFVTTIVVALFKFYRDLKTVLDTKDVDTYGLMHIKKKWEEVIKEQNQFRFKRSHVGVKYHSKDGKRATLFKEQDIIALKSGVMQIVDTDLKADGYFDWDTFKSSPGTPQIAQRKSVVLVHEIVTTFDKPLPLNKPFYREMSVEQVDSYTKKIEDLGFVVSFPTETACLSVEVPNHVEIVDAKGIVTFGRYKMDVFPEPQQHKENKIFWIIQNPQVGEKYTLTWRVK